MGADDDGRSAHSRNGIVIKRSVIVVAGRAARSGANAEVRFHIEMETEKYVRQGMAPAELAVARSGTLVPWRNTRRKLATPAA